MTERRRSYDEFMNAMYDAVNPIIDALKAQYITADLFHTGGGCFVLEIPLDEHRARVMWLGWDETGDEMLAHPWAPKPEELIVGCVYVADNVGDFTAYGVLDPQRHDGSIDSLASAIRSAGWQAIAFSHEDMTSL